MVHHSMATNNVEDLPDLGQVDTTLSRHVPINCMELKFHNGSHVPTVRCYSTFVNNLVLTFALYI